MTTEMIPAQDSGLAEKKTPQATLKALLLNSKEALAAVATRNLSPDKLVKMLGLAASRQPKLLECTSMSILNFAMTCAELGLVPGTLGTIYAVPFKRNYKDANDKWQSVTECQTIIGYRGLVALARRSGEILDIACDVVRLGDDFEWENGTDAKLTHVPKAPLNATMTHAWCVARFKDGGRQITVMRRDEILAIKARSKSKDNGPWVTDEAEMWKKTAIRRGAKLWPLSPEVEKMIEVADRAEIAFVDLAGSEEIPEGSQGQSKSDALAAKHSKTPNPAPTAPDPAAVAQADASRGGAASNETPDAGSGSMDDIADQMTVPETLLPTDAPPVGTVDRSGGRPQTRKRS